MTSGPRTRSRSRQRPPQSLESVYSLAENAVTFFQKAFDEIEEQFRSLKFVKPESLKRVWTKVAVSRRGTNLATLTESQCKSLADEIGGESGGASYVDKVKKLQELAILSGDVSSLFSRLDKKLAVVLTEGLCVYCVSLIELTQEANKDVQEYEDFIDDQNKEFARRVTELKQGQQRWTNYTRDMSSTVRNFEKLEGIFLEARTAWDVITSCIEERIGRDKSYPGKLSHLINQAKEEIEDLKQEYLLIGENEQHAASQQRQRLLQLEKCKRHRAQLRTSLAQTKKAHKFCSDRLIALERDLSGGLDVKQAEDKEDSSRSDENECEEEDVHTESQVTSEQNESDTSNSGIRQIETAVEERNATTKAKKKVAEKQPKGKAKTKSAEVRKEEANRGDEETQNVDLKDADIPSRKGERWERNDPPQTSAEGKHSNYRQSDEEFPNEVVTRGEGGMEKRENRQVSRGRQRQSSEKECEITQSTGRPPMGKRNQKRGAQQKAGGSSGSESQPQRSIEKQKKQQVECYRRRTENMQKEQDQLREALAKVERRISELQKEVEDAHHEGSFNDGRRAEIQAEISRLEMQIIDCRAILHRRGRGQTLMELQKTGRAKVNQKIKSGSLQEACQYVACRVLRDWPQLYMYLPMQPPRTRDQVREDINSLLGYDRVNVVVRRDRSAAEDAMAALYKWMDFNRYASVLDLADALDSAGWSKWGSEVRSRWGGSSTAETVEGRAGETTAEEDMGIAGKSKSETETEEEETKKSDTDREMLADEGADSEYEHTAVSSRKSNSTTSISDASDDPEVDANHNVESKDEDVRWRREGSDKKTGFGPEEYGKSRSRGQMAQSKKELERESSKSDVETSEEDNARKSTPSDTKSTNSKRASENRGKKESLQNGQTQNVATVSESNEAQIGGSEDGSAAVDEGAEPKNTAKLNTYDGAEAVETVHASKVTSVEGKNKDESSNTHKKEAKGKKTKTKAGKPDSQPDLEKEKKDKEKQKSKWKKEDKARGQKAESKKSTFGGDKIKKKHGQLDDEKENKHEQSKMEICKGDKASSDSSSEGENENPYAGDKTMAADYAKSIQIENPETTSYVTIGEGGDNLEERESGENRKSRETGSENGPDRAEMGEEGEERAAKDAKVHQNNQSIHRAEGTEAVNQEENPVNKDTNRDSSEQEKDDDTETVQKASIRDADGGSVSELKTEEKSEMTTGVEESGSSTKSNHTGESGQTSEVKDTSKMVATENSAQKKKKGLGRWGKKK